VDKEPGAAEAGFGWKKYDKKQIFLAGVAR